MNEVRAAKPKKLSSVARFELLIGLLLLFSGIAVGQGNTVSGHVFGIDRRPLGDVNVELLDDLSRTISRGRTNASGRYWFRGLSSGRFRVRVLPLGTDYEEQEQDVEIVNFARTTGVGDTRILGSSNEVRDFYLTPRRVATGLAAPATVFAQEVPDPARKLYKEALVSLENQKTQEGYAALKSAIEIFPKYFAALEMLGTEYVKAGHFEAAQILLAIAVNVNPRAYKSWYALARAYAEQGNEKEALEAAKKALEINAIAAESLFLIGKLLRRAKDYVEAEKYLTKANLVTGGAAADVHFELALLYGHGMKKYKEAAKELKLYLKARPDDKNAENIKKLIVDFESKAKTTS